MTQFEANGLGVRNPNPGDTKTLSKAIKYFNKQVKDSGNLREYNTRKEFVKKSEKQREQRKKAKFMEKIRKKNEI